MSSVHTQNLDQTSMMYVEQFIDVAENLPINVARVISRIHEIDVKRTKIATMIDEFLQDYISVSKFCPFPQSDY